MDYWYDIYGLSDKRDLVTIETFLGHFADRTKIESRPGELITLTPDILPDGKNLLFKRLYATASGSPPRADQTKTAEPETVQVNTLSQAIELGISRADQAFSLYIRTGTRKDLGCLIVHFTSDQQVVLGVSVLEQKNSYPFFRRSAANPDQDRYPQKIKAEMEKVVPLKATAIMFEQPPPDTEREFRNLKARWNTTDSLAKYLHRRTQNWEVWDYLDGGYYYKYRDLLHRQGREPDWGKKKIVNVFDNYTIGDRRGRIINIKQLVGNILDYREVRGKDVVKLPYLGYLLREAVERGKQGFQPVVIHRVSVPVEAKAESIWKGHRDRASDFTTFEGVKVSAVFIEESYCLDKIEDLRKLAQEGLFQWEDAWFHASSVEAYEQWLVKHRQGKLYLALLEDKDIPLRLNIKTLLETSGKKDWSQFLSYLQQHKINNKALKELLKAMCLSGSWLTSQIADILSLVSIPEKELQDLLNKLAPSARFYETDFLPDKQFEQYKLLYSKKKKQIPLAQLITGIKEAIKNRNSPEAAKFLVFYQQELEKKQCLFCDYSLILAFATREDFSDMLTLVLKLLPEEKRRSPELLNIGLITDNEAILGLCNYSPADLAPVQQAAEALLQNRQEDILQLLNQAIEEKNYFQIAYLSPQVPASKLQTPLVDAAKEGMLGIVKLLVEQGKTAPQGWKNYPMKFANQEGFHKMKQYLLSQGLPDEEFTVRM